jgi:hypothetical protein
LKGGHLLALLLRLIDSIKFWNFLERGALVSSSAACNWLVCWRPRMAIHSALHVKGEFACGADLCQANTHSSRALHCNVSDPCNDPNFRTLTGAEVTFQVLRIGEGRREVVHCATWNDCNPGEC